MISCYPVSVSWRSNINRSLFQLNDMGSTTFRYSFRWFLLDIELSTLIELSCGKICITKRVTMWIFAFALLVHGLVWSFCPIEIWSNFMPPLLFREKNVQIVDLEDTMALFMELQVIGDRAVKKLAFSHIVHSIRRMNQKHKNDTQNRKLQNILYKFLQVCNIFHVD